MGRRHSSSGGFTLLEVLVVLLLIGIAMTVSAISLARSLEAAKVRGAARDLVAALRYTRGQAIVSGEQQALEIDLEKRTFTAPKRAPVELPQKLTMKFLTAEEEQTSAHSGRVRFFPDGSSSGGRVRVIGTAHEWDVEIAWLTGAVRINEMDARP